MSSDQCKALINSGMTYWLWGVVARVPGLGAGQAELTQGLFGALQSHRG